VLIDNFLYLSYVIIRQPIRTPSVGIQGFPMELENDSFKDFSKKWQGGEE